MSDGNSVVCSTDLGERLLERDGRYHIINSSFPRRRESRLLATFQMKAAARGDKPQSGIPAFAGMTRKGNPALYRYPPRSIRSWPRAPWPPPASRRHSRSGPGTAGRRRSTSGSDRKSVAEGKCVYVRLVHGGRRIIKKKNT